MVEWDIRETTTEPLSTDAVDDPFTCDLYAYEKIIFDSDIHHHVKIYKCYTELNLNEI